MNSETLQLVILSDTHNFHDRIQHIPDGNVLIHCGDATGVGSIQEILAFNQWLGSLPHQHKLFIPGNHDWLFQKDFNFAKILLNNATVLCDQSILIEGFHFYGSPWQPEFGNWAFNLPRGEELKKKWDQIPECTDVLITHGPPYGILDTIPPFHKEHKGCEELNASLSRIKPQINCFGHIHGGAGILVGGGTTYINASICDEEYCPKNEPVRITLSKRKR